MKIDMVVFCVVGWSLVEFGAVGYSLVEKNSLHGGNLRFDSLVES